MTKSIPQITWQWRTFEQLSKHQMQAMFALRQKVFVVEQECPYLDIDGKDEVAHHLLGWCNRELVATLRVFSHYPEYQNNASIGRICTHQNIRNTGMGRLLVAKAIGYIEVNFPGQSIQIGAQHYLKRFYEQFEFEIISDIYDEDGIDHVLMLRSNPPSNGTT